MVDVLSVLLVEYVCCTSAGVVAADIDCPVGEPTNQVELCLPLSYRFLEQNCIKRARAESVFND